MADSNARRDKALEDIARQLHEANGILRDIKERLPKQQSPLTRPDPFDQPQLPQPVPEIEPTSYAQKYFGKGDVQ